jgi:uncharacterized protein (TIGR03083 family)
MLVSPRYEGPTIMSITGDPGAQLEPVVRQRRRFESMVNDLDDDDWSSASRCEGWTVHDVVAHIVGVNAFWNASVRAGLAGSPTRVLVGFDPVETPALMVAPMRALSPGEVLEQLVASNDAFLDAISGLSDTGWAALAEAPPGHLPVCLVVRHALWDCWVHERDVALPLGLIPPAEPDEVASSLRYVGALSPAFAVQAGFPCEGVYALEATDPTVHVVLDVGASVAVRDDVAPPGAPCLRGDAVALVEALSLRAPLPASCPGEWQQLLRGLATVFSPH